MKERILKWFIGEWDHVSAPQCWCYSWREALVQQGLRGLLNLRKIGKYWRLRKAV